MWKAKIEVKIENSFAFVRCRISINKIKWVWATDEVGRVTFLVYSRKKRIFSFLCCGREKSFKDCYFVIPTSRSLTNASNRTIKTSIQIAFAPKSHNKSSMKRGQSSPLLRLSQQKKTARSAQSRCALENLFVIELFTVLRFQYCRRIWIENVIIKASLK